MPGANLPNTGKIELMIVGAQKAGTTSLKFYLGEHPRIQSHLHKEFAYFTDISEYGDGMNAAWKKYFGKIDPEKHIVVKNAGIYANENGLKLLSRHNPDCRIAIVLRNPVDRT
ncbi:MAG TPA: hypothetical protein VFU15_04100, partial [Bacteroidia bacterium]|nr:hypothetical protein [Bacteroidia bacterium]